MTIRTLIVSALLAAGLCPAASTSEASLSKIPLHFEPDRGQFLVRASGYTVRIAPRRAEVSLPDGQTALAWVGASDTASAVAENRLPGVSHYFLGNDAATWRTDVAHYQRVRVEDLYDGIDLVYYGRGRLLEFDLELEPGADARLVRFRLDGATLSPDGTLAVPMAAGALRQLEPVVYQVHDGKRSPVAARYVALGTSEFGFELDHYDPARELVIDPVLEYSTYLGGSGLDVIHALSVNSKGEVTVAGESGSPDFPVNGHDSGAKTGAATGNVFVTKLNAGGTSVLWSAFLGGSGADTAHGLAVGVDGFTHVTGYTTSEDFPVTATATQRQIGDVGGSHGDAFVVRLAAGGKVLMYSSYLGGSHRDEGRGITFGAGGDMFVTGLTESPDFPTTPGAYQTEYHGPDGSDAFVTQLLSAGPSIIYSTFLGGTNDDAGHDIAIDTDGFTYVTGITFSSDFPVRAAVAPMINAGKQSPSSDAFVTKLMPGGAEILFSTFLGGSAGDVPGGLALDRNTHIYIAGETASADFPTTAGALQRNHADEGANTDAFAVKLDRSGSKLSWATYFGGRGFDRAHALAATPSGGVTIAGETDSGAFATGDSDCILSFPAGGRDAFLARILEGGAELGFVSYLGGAGTDRALGVAIDVAGNVYLGGQTDSRNFPVTPGALRNRPQTIDGFVAKVSPKPAGEPRCISAAGIVNAASYQSGGVSPGEIVTIYGKDIGPEDLIRGTVIKDKFTDDLAQTKIFFGEFTAPIIYVFETQISAIVPYGVASQPVTKVRLLRRGTYSNTVEIPVLPAVPGIFSLDSSGLGQGAVHHPDYSVNGPANPIDRGGIVILYTTGEGETNPAGVDGQLAVGVYPKPRLPVSVRIGGVEAEVLYAGAAPGLVAGVMQVNVRVPEGIEPGGAVPVDLKVGQQVSPPGITIAVK